MNGLASSACNLVSKLFCYVCYSLKVQRLHCISWIWCHCKYTFTNLQFHSGCFLVVAVVCYLFIRYSEFPNDFDHMMNVNWATILCVFLSVCLAQSLFKSPMFDIYTTSNDWIFRYMRGVCIIPYLRCCFAFSLHNKLRWFGFSSYMNDWNGTIVHHHLQSPRQLTSFLWRKKHAVAQITDINLLLWSLTFVWYLSLNSPLLFSHIALKRCHCTLCCIAFFPICPTNWHTQTDNKIKQKLR